MPEGVPRASLWSLPGKSLSWKNSWDAVSFSTVEHLTRFIHSGTGGTQSPGLRTLGTFNWDIFCHRRCNGRNNVKLSLKWCEIGVKMTLKWRQSTGNLSITYCHSNGKLTSFWRQINVILTTNWRHFDDKLTSFWRQTDVILMVNYGNFTDKLTLF